jgi:hypothetical protein
VNKQANASYSAGFVPGSKVSESPRIACNSSHGATGLVWFSGRVLAPLMELTKPVNAKSVQANAMLREGKKRPPQRSFWKLLGEDGQTIISPCTNQAKTLRASGRQM